MYKYTDACTPSDQGVGSDPWWMGHVHGIIKGNTHLNTTTQRGWGRYGKQGGHAYMY